MPGWPWLKLRPVSESHFEFVDLHASSQLDQQFIPTNKIGLAREVTVGMSVIDRRDESKGYMNDAMAIANLPRNGDDDSNEHNSGTSEGEKKTRTNVVFFLRRFCASSLGLEGSFRPMEE